MALIGERGVGSEATGHVVVGLRYISTGIGGSSAEIIDAEGACGFVFFSVEVVLLDAGAVVFVFPKCEGGYYRQDNGGGCEDNFDLFHKLKVGKGRNYGNPGVVPRIACFLLAYRNIASVSGC